MNVSSECVGNFYYYNQLELLLLILVYIHMSCFVYFGEKCTADRSWKFISVGPDSWKGHGKVMENDFPKRVVTLHS